MFENYKAKEKAKESLLYKTMDEIVTRNGTWGMYQMDERASSYNVRMEVLDLSLTHELVPKSDSNIEFDEAKKLATSFFYWWYNASGSNTEDGFDLWWETIGEAEFGGNNVEKEKQA